MMLRGSFHSSMTSAYSTRWLLLLCIHQQVLIQPAGRGKATSLLLPFSGLTSYLAARKGLGMCLLPGSHGSVRNVYSSVSNIESPRWNSFQGG